MEPTLLQTLSDWPSRIVWDRPNLEWASGQTVVPVKSRELAASLCFQATLSYELLKK